jgi:hypothetical protein
VSQKPTRRPRSAPKAATARSRGGIDPPAAVSRGDEIVEEIRERLGADAGAVRRQLEIFREVDSRMAPIGKAAAIKKAAKEFRTKFHGFRSKGRPDKFAELLQATLPRSFEVIDRELEWLGGIVGPDVRFERTKWLAAECARILIGPSAKADDPVMRDTAALVYEYLTGEPDQNLERARRAVLRKIF